MLLETERGGHTCEVREAGELNAVAHKTVKHFVALDRASNNILRPNQLHAGEVTEKDAVLHDERRTEGTVTTLVTSHRSSGVPGDIQVSGFFNVCPFTHLPARDCVTSTGSFRASHPAIGHDLGHTAAWSSGQRLTRLNKTQQPLAL